MLAEECVGLLSDAHLVVPGLHGAEVRYADGELSGLTLLCLLGKTELNRSIVVGSIGDIHIVDIESLYIVWRACALQLDLQHDVVEQS